MHGELYRIGVKHHLLYAGFLAVVLPVKGHLLTHLKTQQTFPSEAVMHNGFYPLILTKGLCIKRFLKVDDNFNM